MQSESFALFDLLHVKNEWDACERLRDRVRTIGRLLTNKPNPGEREYAVEGKCLQTVENVKYNMDVLVPLVKRLGDQAWSVRSLLYVGKGYMYRDKPPKDSSFSLLKD